MHERTGAEHWREAWRESAERLGRSGATVSGSRSSTGKPRALSSVRPTASPATSSRSPRVASSTLRRRDELERARDRDPGRVRRSAPTGSASGRRRSSRPRHAAGDADAVVPRCARASSPRSRSFAPGDEQLTELLRRRRRADLAGRAAREGRPALPRHRRQRLRVPEAVRAHRRRALARARPRASRCTPPSRSSGSDRARPWPPLALDRRPRHRCLPPRLPRRHDRLPDRRSLLGNPGDRVALAAGCTGLMV